MDRLGITVCYLNQKRRPPFLETQYFYELSMEGRKHQLELIVFNPKEVNWKTRTVPGWRIHPSKRWEQQIFQLPKLIYDRCYYVNRQHYFLYKPSVQKLYHDPQIRFLGRPLGGKYQTYQILKKCPSITPYLPETIRFQSMKNLNEMIEKYHSICLKPNGGSHGRGVIKITPFQRHVLIQGRSLTNQLFQQWMEFSQLQDWLQKWTQQTRYIIQPYLPLTTPQQSPFDIRILVQKGGDQQWHVTGSAVRIGKAHSLTSNLHGGGSALPFIPFLQENYDQEIQQKIQNSMDQITSTVPTFIEQNYGPLVELGLDIGIDRKGNVWILEVNSKPGRSVFLRTGHKKTHHLAIQLPILYAKSLLRSPRRCNPVISYDQT